ncbi:TPA: hypothetical protein N0F65_007331 [Lagenidium giganteum]|uniref:Uncharacterized protein n=1 Tax=Lagenidium giganteum TaxID=4803 RepID=A0AAV2Z5R5_9STRA|nr:TPA: hypothetical protein N0F65_007331 [Lagenidium giganteum]
MTTPANDSAEYVTAELQRLESNHKELLLHKQTLEKQFVFKQEQLDQIRAAMRESKKLLQAFRSQRAQPTASSTEPEPMAVDGDKAGAVKAEKEVRP